MKIFQIFVAFSECPNFTMIIEEIFRDNVDS